MKPEDITENLVESIAEGMWDLLGDVDHEKDWSWCCKNEPDVASELRYRARHAIARSKARVKESRPTRLDLSFKDAFVSGDVK